MSRRRTAVAVGSHTSDPPITPHYTVVQPTHYSHSHSCHSRQAVQSLVRALSSAWHIYLLCFLVLSLHIPPITASQYKPVYVSRANYAYMDSEFNTGSVVYCNFVSRPLPTASHGNIVVVLNPVTSGGYQSLVKNRQSVPASYENCYNVSFAPNVGTMLSPSAYSTHSDDGTGPIATLTHKPSQLVSPHTGYNSTLQSPTYYVVKGHNLDYVNVYYDDAVRHAYAIHTPAWSASPVVLPETFRITFANYINGLLKYKAATAVDIYLENPSTDSNTAAVSNVTFAAYNDPNYNTAERPTHYSLTRESSKYPHNTLMRLYITLHNTRLQLATAQLHAPASGSDSFIALYGDLGDAANHPVSVMAISGSWLIAPQYMLVAALAVVTILFTM